MTPRIQMARVVHYLTLYLFPASQNASSAIVCRVASHKSYELYLHVYRTLRQLVTIAPSRHQLERVLKYRSKRIENKDLDSNHTNSSPPSLFDVAHFCQMTNDIWDFFRQLNHANKPMAWQIRQYRQNSKLQ